MLKKGSKIIHTLCLQLKKQNISVYSASTAFFFFLSMVPFLIVLCTMIPYTPLTEENLVKAITDIMPDMVDPLIESLIAQVYQNFSTILPIAVLTTIWSAGKGMLALMRGLNVVDGVEEKRNYFVVRLVASFYTVIMLLIVLVSLLIMVFGNKLVNLILYRIPSLKTIVTLIMNLRFMFIWLILIVLFAAIYAYVPNKKQKFSEQLPGAVFTSVVWSIFSWGFSIYVELSDFSIYGSLAIIIIIMLWMYFCMYIIMVGAFINEYCLTVQK